MKRTSALSMTAAGLFLAAGHAEAQVQHGLITVVENDGGNNESSVDESRAPGGFGAWTVVGGNRGDIDVDFGFASDVASGALITTPAQDGRSEPSVDADPYFYTTHASPGSLGSLDKWFIPIAQTRTGSEVNADVNVAYFPYADGWLAGYGWNDSDMDDEFDNDTNGGVITDFVGNPGVTICNAFEGCTGNGFEILDSDSGDFALHIPGADVRRDGIALLIGAKNEDNYGLVSTQPSEAFDFAGDLPAEFDQRSTVFFRVKDNGDDGGGEEQDPFAFVWIPENTEGVVMGNFTGQPTKLFSQGDWSVERIGIGEFRLTIPGEGPDTGTLIVQNTHLTGNNLDNVVFSEPDGDGWIITTRDIEPDGMFPQDLASSVICHFAFFPDDTEITGPGTPTPSDPEAVDSTAAGRFVVTEFNGSNDFGAADADLDLGDGRLDIAGVNRGDIGLTFVNGLIGDEDGVTIPVITEFVRDNGDTGGASGDGNAAFDNGLVRTFNADGFGGEMNINFAAAHFPVTSGFIQAFDVGAGGAGGVDIDLSDVDPSAAQNGVLIATNWDNNNRTNNVNPITGGFNITAFEAQGADIGLPAIDSVETGFVYLPYSTEGLIAGQIDDSGTILNGTGGFTVAQGAEDELGFDVWKLSIDGVDASTDGVLLLNPTGSEPTQFAWEADGNGDFEIGFLRLTDQTEILPGFNFAFIPFEGLTAGEDCPADLTGPGGDGVPDGSLSADDFFFYLGLFSDADPRADLTGPGGDGVPDGSLTADDFFFYLGLFAAGCP